MLSSLFLLEKGESVSTIVMTEDKVIFVVMGNGLKATVTTAASEVTIKASKIKLNGKEFQCMVMYYYS